jgi:hypothetical protein
MNKTQLLTVAVLAASALATGALAQSPAQAPSPAPQVAPAPNEVIYLQKLPTPAELISSAAAGHGVTIDKIDQTGSQITVVYHFDNGQVNTVSYQLIGAADSSAAPAPVAGTEPAGIPAPTTAAPAVVYQSYPSPYYYGYAPYPGYYWPGWFAPIGVGFNFGWGHGYHHWR